MAIGERPRRPPGATEGGDDGLGGSNVRAWDRLYRETVEPVWGRAPVGFLERFLEAAGLELAPGNLVLDAACGEGRNLPVLERLGGTVVACDYSLHGLTRVAAAGGGKLVRCRLESLPIAGRRVSLVLASDILETLPDLSGPLAEIHRILADGGYLLANVPGMDDGIAGEEMELIGPHEYLYRERFYYRFMEPGEARRLFERQGFTIRREESCSWSEEAHPGFRDGRHRHTSTVFLVQRASPPGGR